jgi:hypothetical protein
MPTLIYSHLANRHDSMKSVTAQLALYFVQEQGESAVFTGVNEYVPDCDWAK